MLTNLLHFLFTFNNGKKRKYEKKKHRKTLRYLIRECYVFLFDNENWRDELYAAVNIFMHVHKEGHGKTLEHFVEHGKCPSNFKINIFNNVEYGHDFNKTVFIEVISYVDPIIAWILLIRVWCTCITSTWTDEVGRTVLRYGYLL